MHVEHVQDRENVNQLRIKLMENGNLTIKTNKRLTSEFRRQSSKILEAIFFFFFFMFEEVQF